MEGTVFLVTGIASFSLLVFHWGNRRASHPLVLFPPPLLRLCRWGVILRCSYDKQFVPSHYLQVSSFERGMRMDGRNQDVLKAKIVDWGKERRKGCSL